jgi:hypothetical protein
MVLEDRPVIRIQLAVSLRSLRERNAEHPRQLQEARVVELLLDPQRSDVVVVEVGVPEVPDADALLTSDPTELLELHVVSLPWAGSRR